MIPASIVISMKRNELGRFRLFSARYKFSIPLHKLEGIDGLAQDRGSCQLQAGTYGCLLSHIEAIKLAKKLELSSVLILEDDVRFVDGFENALALAMSELPDNWDCLWLGGYDHEKPMPYSQKLNILVSSYGGYSYILRNTLYDFFINKLEQLDKSCDEHYRIHQKEFNSFRTVRPLVLHSHISSVRINADNGIAI